MYTYTCLNPIAAVGLDQLTAEYQKVETLNEAKAAFVRSAAMHDLDLPDTLEAVVRAGAGVNNIPLEKCAEKGIVVFNTPGANANGVKELVLTGMLLASRDIVGGINWVLDNKEEEGIAKTTEKAKKQFAGTEIAGKTLGVLGLGAIGRKVANAAAALGMKVVGYDPFLSIENALTLSPEVTYVKKPEEVYKVCDFLTIHTPLVDSTKGMVNKEAFAQMKDHVVILNFARDILVAEDDLLDALKSGKVRKYVTDFPNTTVAGVEGVIATPHLGASTAESEDNCAVMGVKELMDYMENGNIRNSVNYPACSLGAAMAPGRVALLYKTGEGKVSEITSAVEEAGQNILAMENKARGEYSYALMDLDAACTEAAAEALEKTEGALKVRVIK